MRNKDYAEYGTWKNMRARCKATRGVNYECYTAKGITVCAEWDDFHQFRADMGPKPTLKHSIDRINDSLGYYPENCRWATQTVQNRNKSGYNKNYTYNGVTACIPELAETFNVQPDAIYKRVYSGQTITEAIDGYTADKASKYITYNELSMTKPEWAEYLGVKLSTMYARFSSGKPLDQILV